VGVGVWGNLSTRFLNIDTPEKSFKLLKSRTADAGSDYTGFTGLDKERWTKFLTNPFTMDSTSYLGPDDGGPLPPYALSIGLYEYLQPKLDGTTAENHYQHAYAATRYLEGLIANDLETLVDGNGEKRFTSKEDFGFFMAFAHEILDNYGRLLCYLKPDEPDMPSYERQESYNLRMVKSGRALPYPIFPNLEPWIKQEMILNAIFGPDQVPALLANTTLGRVRAAVIQAQDPNNPQGVFADVLDENGDKLAGPLALSPHELRFLAARRPPSRYVIELSQQNFAGVLVHPENYYKVALEDRLYIPVEYVPLFVERGWQKQTLAYG
jgi:hypothetical protein